MFFMCTVGLMLLALVACKETAQAIAPDFQIKAYQGAAALGGEEVRLSDVLARGQPVVLNFWAGACPPCRAEMPDFQAVAEQYQGRVLLFGLDVGPFIGLGSRDDGLALLKELKISYPAGTTFDSKVIEAYGLLGMPTTYFITPKGRIIKTWIGPLTRDALIQQVEMLLAASN